jgi:CrcB protein
VSVLFVAAGAAIGAPLRFLTDRALQRMFPGRFPWGTFVVNVVGSFVLGLVTATAGPSVSAIMGTGFCGALTTYSTFSYETVRLIEGRNRLVGVTNVVASVLVGIAAATAGLVIGTGI